MYLSQKYVNFISFLWISSHSLQVTNDGVSDFRLEVLLRLNERRIVHFFALFAAFRSLLTPLTLPCVHPLDNCQWSGSSFERIPMSQNYELVKKKKKKKAPISMVQTLQTSLFCWLTPCVSCDAFEYMNFFVHFTSIASCFFFAKPLHAIVLDSLKVSAVSSCCSCPY